MKHQSTPTLTACSPRSQHFILRIWQPSTANRQRITIYHTQTGQQHYFTNLEQAIAWLTEHTGGNS